MKLVNFKRSVDDLEGRRILVLGGASFAEALYPHVAFRPVLEIGLLLRSADVQPFAHFLARHNLTPADGASNPDVVAVVPAGRRVRQASPAKGHAGAVGQAGGCTGDGAGESAHPSGRDPLAPDALGHLSALGLRPAVR